MMVLVCGSRGWSLRQPIRNELGKLRGEVTVIHGSAKGADTIAGEIASELGFRVIACPAEWKRYGRAAGIIRNRQMLQDYRPELVLAFVRDPQRSPGSRHTVTTAREMGIPVLCFDEEGPVDV